MSGQTSESVRALIANPRRGPANITLRTGVQKSGEILRVTSQFVAFRETQSRTCQNLDLAQIAALHLTRRGSAPYAERVAGDVLIGGIFAAHDAVHPKHEHIAGYWHAAKPSPGGTFTRLGIGLLENNRVIRREVQMSKGKYEIKDQELHLLDDQGRERALPIRFECNTLLLGARKLIAAEYPVPRPAADPIVGQWWEDLDRAATFQTNNAFELATTQSSQEGRFEQTGNRFTVTWNSPAHTASEQWDLQIKDNHLFVTVAGAKSEYTR